MINTVKPLNLKGCQNICLIFWNRKEVYCGLDMKTFSHIRTILTQNNIPYIHRVVNQGGNGGSQQLGTLGQNLSLQNMYYLYIHKNNYDQAVFLINQ